MDNQESSWGFAKLVDTPFPTNQERLSRITLCSAWLSIEHGQKQRQWGIYAGFSPCHWLLLLVVLLISCNGILFSSKWNQWSVYIGNRAQMSRNLHKNYLILKFFLYFWPLQNTPVQIILLLLTIQISFVITIQAVLKNNDDSGSIIFSRMWIFQYEKDRIKYLLSTDILDERK